MAMNRMRRTANGPRRSSRPELLTAEEAAALARCSIKTVRRAYASGALLAYRRRGSRAVLLDREDVLSWVHGEVVQSVPPARPEVGPTQRAESHLGVRAPRARPTGALGSDASPRFDLSATALRERRAAKA
jgi:excisionase family DNA binding protein